MIKFEGTENNALKAGVLVITNVSDTVKTVFAYIPNKDLVPFYLAPGAVVEVTTLNAGETFSYMNQALAGALTVAYKTETVDDGGEEG